MRQSGFAMLALIVLMTMAAGMVAGIVPNMLFVRNRDTDHEERLRMSQYLRADDAFRNATSSSIVPPEKPSSIRLDEQWRQISNNAIKARGRQRLRILRALYLRRLMSEHKSLSEDQQAELRATMGNYVLRRRELSFTRGQRIPNAQAIMQKARKSVEQLLSRLGVSSATDQRTQSILTELGPSPGIKRDALGNPYLTDLTGFVCVGPDGRRGSSDDY